MVDMGREMKPIDFGVSENVMTGVHVSMSAVRGNGHIHIVLDHECSTAP